MASMFEQPRNGTLFLGGQKISGSDIRDQNGTVMPLGSTLLLGCLLTLISAVSATQAIANVVKSSFGPHGLDKMMVDDIGVSSSARFSI